MSMECRPTVAPMRKLLRLLSLVTERSVFGIYNRTHGFVVDGLQSGLDYIQNAVGRGSRNSLTPDRKCSGA